MDNITHPTEYWFDIDVAHKIFRERSRSLDDMKDELHDCAASAYKNHPNPDMRKFWGLE
jgi:hypothetical protein